MIPNTFIQDLLSRLDVVDVVGKYVQLKKSGVNFSGLCPFHNEKTPSFTVNSEKQFYHCFGCGAHGTAINFLMEHTGLSFPEAVEELSQSLGLQVPKAENRQSAREVEKHKQRQLSLLEVMQKAMAAYTQQLRAYPDAIHYLKARGLTGQIAAQFKLGYAPVKAHFLDVLLPESAQALVDTGLVIVRDQPETSHLARRFDRFRDRIMFPIRNAKGEVIAFGGRILEQGEPKYLNSPETVLFNKSHELYGLFEAKAAIRQRQFALIVEGYMDVVALAQHGFANAVATLGTACTRFHIQKILRYTQKVVFSFDGDAAGKKAAKRALEACLPFVSDQREMRFLFLPQNHDPDSFIREFGADVFAQNVEQAMPLSLFLINEIVMNKEIATPEGRAQALAGAKPLLELIPESVLRGQIIQLLAQRLQMHLQVVSEILVKADSIKRQTYPMRLRQTYAVRREVQPMHQRILRNLVKYPHLALHLSAHEADVLCHENKDGEIFQELLQLIRNLDQVVDFHQLSKLLPGAQYASVFEKVMQDVTKDQEDVRDLSIEQEPTTEQAHLMAQELQRAILKMEYDACNARLDKLSGQKIMSAIEREEFMALQKKRADFKLNLGVC